MIEVGKFAKVKSKSLSDNGFNEGDLCYVAGNAALPKEEGSYDLRLYFIIGKLVNDHIDIEAKGFLVDPDNLEPVDEFTNERLKKLLEEDFGGDE